MNGRLVQSEVSMKNLSRNGVERAKYYNKMRRSDIFDILEQERKQRSEAAERENAELLKKYAHIPSHPAPKENK
jgi:ribosomal protein S21